MTKLTLQAWRIFSLLEETNDPLVGRSLAFIYGNLALTAAALEEAVEELLQAGLIESIYGMERYRLKRTQEQSRQKPDVAPVFPADEVELPPEANQLILEVNENLQLLPALKFKGVTLSFPGIRPDWLYRVQLCKDQYMVAFPKHFTVGIGFALEEDYDRNFAFTSKAEDIYEHIKCNKKYAEIPDRDCIEAIRFLQEEIQERLCGPAFPSDEEGTR